MVDIYSKDPYANKLYEEASQMSQQEQFISFLNMFFVFKKVRDVDLSNFNINVDDEEYKIPEEIIVEPKTIVEVKSSSKKTAKPVISDSGIIKKYDMTIVLENVTKTPKTVKIKEPTETKKTRKVTKKIDVPKISEDSSSEDEKVTIISKPKKTKSKP